MRKTFYDFLFFCLKVFNFTNSIDPDEMLHNAAVWVFTVCKSTRLGVSCIQRVKCSRG